MRRWSTTEIILRENEKEIRKEKLLKSSKPAGGGKQYPLRGGRRQGGHVVKTPALAERRKAPAGVNYLKNGGANDWGGGEQHQRNIKGMCPGKSEERRQRNERGERKSSAARRDPPTP